jgi:hypothetical protein
MPKGTRRALLTVTGNGDHVISTNNFTETLSLDVYSQRQGVVKH